MRKIKVRVKAVGRRKGNNTALGTEDMRFVCRFIKSGTMRMRGVRVGV